MSSLVREVLKTPAAGLPLYLSSFRLDVAYNAGMAPDEERREVLEDAFGELKEAFRLGFFCWEKFASRETAEIDVRWSEDGDMSIMVSSAGLHYNALVAAVRIVARLHHTSRVAYETMRELLGDDADALSPAMTFRENVASIVVSGVSGAEQADAATADVLNYTSEGIVTPAYAALQGDVGENYEGGRLVVTSASEAGFRVGSLSEIEDCFLRVFGSGVFTSISDLDGVVSDNEAEIFTRNRDGRTELLFGDYSDEKYGVIEFLNVVSGGQIGRLTVRDENDG